MEKETIELNKKLEALIAINMARDKDISLRNKIALLARLDLDNSSISRILGISTNHVRKEKSLLGRVDKDE